MNAMRLEAVQRARAADLDRLLNDLEERLSRLTRTLPAARAAANGMDRAGDVVAAALSDIADRFRNRARTAGRRREPRRRGCACNLETKRLRKLAHEVEQRPLVTLAIAVGIGALAAGLLARR